MAGCSGCSADFDRSVCWDRADYGELVERVCPFTYCPSVTGCEQVAQTFRVSRQCGVNGDWSSPNYNQCLTVVHDYAHCIVGFCRVCPDVLRDLVISVSLTLSIVSVALLVAAIVLFSVFDSIQCRRLAIHKNLAVAFVFRFSVLAVWTVVQSSNLFQDCSSFHPTYLLSYEWVCKGILWFVIYFQVASVMWMLIEGAYLYSRFTVFAMRHSDAPYYLYLLAGWGVPFAVVLSWTVVHEVKSRGTRSFCWLPYAQGNHLWILAGTMGFALIATLLLVPLLGVSNIPLFYEPDEPSSAYMLGSAILQHSQGIFIAVLYCFLNSEIQTAVKRQLSKVPFHFLIHRNHFETERTYVPENRQHSKNAKLGVPMGELNGSANRERSKADGSRGNSAGNVSCTTSLVAPIATAEEYGGSPPRTQPHAAQPQSQLQRANSPQTEPLLPAKSRVVRIDTECLSSSIKSIDRVEVDSSHSILD